LPLELELLAAFDDLLTKDPAPPSLLGREVAGTPGTVTWERRLITAAGVEASRVRAEGERPGAVPPTNAWGLVDDRTNVRVLSTGTTRGPAVPVYGYRVREGAIGLAQAFLTPGELAALRRTWDFGDSAARRWIADELLRR
jgi:hypothetical protein